MGNYKPDPLRPELNMRHEAVFFISEECLEDRSLFDQSNNFYIEHQDILPRGFGVLGQVGRAPDSNYEKLPPTESLIFDARRRDEGLITWELVQGDKGSRKIWQLDTTCDGVSGRTFKTNCQGLLMINEPIDSEDTLHVSRYILGVLWGTYVQKTINKKYMELSTAILKLGELSVQRNQRKVVHQQEVIDRIGFGTLEPYRPPQVIKTQGYVSEDGKRLFYESVSRSKRYQS